jgi:hypothetical protein
MRQIGIPPNYKLLVGWSRGFTEASVRGSESSEKPKKKLWVELGLGAR